MFDFKKKVLSPLVKGFTDKIDEALKKQSAVDKMETLLSMRDAVNEGFSRISNMANGKVPSVLLVMLAVAKELSTSRSERRISERATLDSVHRHLIVG
jgi:hypothetical protein